MTNDIPVGLTEQQIFDLKMQGEIVEIEGYDCFGFCFEIDFLKEDVRCDQCGKTLKKKKTAGAWYIPVRYPNKQIIKWACGCITIRDFTS